MQIPFRLGEGLLPLVAGDRAQLGEQLVFGDLQASGLRRPVGEKAQQSEGRRPHELDDGAHALEGFEDLFGLSCRDAFARAQCLARDLEELSRGARPGDAVGLRVLVDLGTQRLVDLHSDEREALASRAARALGGRPRRPLGGLAQAFSGLAGGVRWRGHGASKRPVSRSCATVLPRSVASAERRRQAARLSSSSSFLASLRAFHSERSRRKRGVLARADGLTRPTTRKSFLPRGVDTERKGGLTAFNLQRRIVWAGLGSRRIGNAPTVEGREKVRREWRTGRE